ncbi:putative RiPP precursor [Mesorhizobium sp. SARCC-RB16n]|nr:putative RiPP precursor [Mesorhizobium sp. SARCC-RB16n]
MKKIYQKPLLVKRDRLSAVAAVCTPSNPCA